MVVKRHLLWLTQFKGTDVDKRNATKQKKLLIDIALGLLYVLLLGYVFTGGQFHEVAGIVFVIAIVVHNVVNKGWYKALKKGTYSRKRKFITVLNAALIADVAVILVTGIINSKYLFHTNIHIAWIGQLHTTLALVGLVLIVSHVLVHVFSHTKKEHGKLPVILIVLAIILMAALKLWGLPYLERHFLTVEIDRGAVISGESVDPEGEKIVTVYFTRVGNTDFDDDVDAVSGASLLLDESKELMGNSQVIALMIQDAIGGELVSINTEKKYPSAYSDTIQVASEELNRQELPELVNMPDNLDEYDTVFLVYPLWWYTIPKSVETFLKSYDFSEKTVIPVVTHGGSGAGKSIEAIKAVCNGTVVDNPLKVYCGDVPSCRESVAEWLKAMYAYDPGR